jgi:hypothetical protein
MIEGVASGGDRRIDIGLDSLRHGSDDFARRCADYPERSGRRRFYPFGADERIV